MGDLPSEVLNRAGALSRRRAPARTFTVAESEEGSYPASQERSGHLPPLPPDQVDVPLNLARGKLDPLTFSSRRGQTGFVGWSELKVATVCALVLIGAGCGGGGEDEDAQPSSTPTTIAKKPPARVPVTAESLVGKWKQVGTLIVVLFRANGTFAIDTSGSFGNTRVVQVSTRCETVRCASPLMRRVSVRRATRGRGGRPFTISRARSTSTRGTSWAVAAASSRMKLHAGRVAACRGTKFGTKRGRLTGRPYSLSLCR